MKEVKVKNIIVIVYTRARRFYTTSPLSFSAAVFLFSTLHRCTKNSEVVFRRSEIENSTSEVDGCGNEEIGRRTLPLSEMLKSS